MKGDGSLVRAGPTALNAWRNNHPDRPIIVIGETFTGLDLSGCNLNNATLNNCHFINCDLRRASFENSDLKRSVFRSCDLSYAVLDGAQLYGSSFISADLTGAKLNRTHYLSRLKQLSVKKINGVAPLYTAESLPWTDRWLSWERLRFLSTIRIFVPAYLSLATSVLLINLFSWANIVIDKMNDIIARNSEIRPDIIPSLEIGWTHIAVVVNFLFLAIAATTFLGCPPRITEFTRERWVFELNQPELLYDHSAWQRVKLRILCASSLAIGGVMSTILLVRAIAKQIAFITTHVS